MICVIALVAGSDPVEKPKWKPITLVTIGIICFALLFERADNPKMMVKLDVEEIREIIKPVGLSPAKAKAIHGLSEILLERTPCLCKK